MLITVIDLGAAIEWRLTKIAFFDGKIAEITRIAMRPYLPERALECAPEWEAATQIPTKVQDEFERALRAREEELARAEKLASSTTREPRQLDCYSAPAAIVVYLPALTCPVGHLAPARET